MRSPLQSPLQPVMRSPLEFRRRRGGGFDPASMFTNGEPGWVYDLSDFSTLFQDSAGTTPVTAVEQPVGLMLDKSQGLVLGPELVVNGNFDSAAGWTLEKFGTPPAGDAVISGGTLTTSFESGANFSYAKCAVSGLVAGRSYLITAGKVSGGALRVGLSNGASTSDSAMSGSTQIIRAESGDNSLVLFAALGTYVLDNISVKLLPGNHASQPTSTKRPVLKIDGSGKYYLEGDGIDDFMSTAAIDFTGTDTVSYWGGVQKLSDTNAGVVFELGTNSATVNGTFGLLAPHTGASSTFAFNSRGTAYAQAVATGYASPYRGTISVANDISTPSLSIAVNSDSAFTSATSQGTGNYSSNPMYFMSRAGTSTFFGGQVYSSILLGRAATPTEAANSKAWVAEKTGVAL